MKRSLLILSLISLPSHADLVESIEKFTDIFGVSLSNSNGETIYTLDVTYDVTDNLRVFGDIDTESNWEAGFGYSFWQGETYYTENTIKVNDRQYSTGIFVAKVLNDRWIAIGDINYNYKLEVDDPLCKGMDICNGNPFGVSYLPSDSIDYSLGAMWSAHTYVDLLYKFNQEVGTSHNVITAFDSGRVKVARTNLIYHEAIMYLNLKYIRPSVTYTISEHFENSVEFGLTFDF
ncbi:hypothetical protein L4C33_03700 [Vibrio makurazakiensis]|uniref:hypothetical protein n=1 Tax=Vibrio makurazakiensis TaxID=2910250 RepID=UPI003D0A04D1